MVPGTFGLMQASATASAAPRGDGCPEVGHQCLPAIAEGDPGAAVEPPADHGLHRCDESEFEELPQREAQDAGLEQGPHEGQHGEDHGEQEDGDGEGAGEGEEAPPVVLLLLPLLMAAVPATVTVATIILAPCRTTIGFVSIFGALASP